MINTNKLELQKIAGELARHEAEWVAISEDTKIVASGVTYGETVRKVKNPEEVVLMKVPPKDASLAPLNE